MNAQAPESGAGRLTLTLAICAKNAADVAETCFESIRGQAEAPDAVMVVVDDTGDTTIPLAKRFGYAVVLNPGKKLYHARNAALAACTTDLLAFTDADCILDRDWVRVIKRVFAEHPEVDAGTGRHPMIGRHNFVSWVHHQWYVVETRKTGYTDGVIGGNSYFRAAALRTVGGWLPVALLGAEDVYISKKLTASGRKIWFDECAVVAHHYRKDFEGFWRQSVMMGRDIVLMMRVADIRDGLWTYTLLIPLLAITGFLSLALACESVFPGALLLLLVAGASLFYCRVQFGSLDAAVPRWAARWIIIWPYSYGIIKGLFEKPPLPDPKA
ncbi:MAG: glycosyltransferase [Fibrobacterota bacterium]